MAAHRVTEKDLLVEVQGNMVIVTTVLFFFILLSQDTAENYSHIAWVQLLLSTAAGTQKHTW